MSLENAHEIMKKNEMKAGWGTEKDDKREILTAQLIVELIEEIRWLRNDLYKLLPNR